MGRDRAVFPTAVGPTNTTNDSRIGGTAFGHSTERGSISPLLCCSCYALLEKLHRVGLEGRKDVIDAGYCLSTISRSSFPALKNGTRLAGICTVSPVLGLRPSRGLRLRIRKLPKPRNSTLSPSLRASVIQFSKIFTTVSVCFLVS